MIYYYSKSFLYFRYLTLLHFVVSICFTPLFSLFAILVRTHISFSFCFVTFSLLLCYLFLFAVRNTGPTILLALCLIYWRARATPLLANVVWVKQSFGLYTNLLHLAKMASSGSAWKKNEKMYVCLVFMLWSRRKDDTECPSMKKKRRNKNKNIGDSDYFFNASHFLGSKGNFFASQSCDQIQYLCFVFVHKH